MTTRKRIRPLRTPGNTKPEPEGAQTGTLGKGCSGRGRRASRGSEVVEAAMTLPILATVLFVLYAFGHGWSIYQTMTRAAREGVRQAVTTSCATCGNSNYSTDQIQSQFIFPAMQAAGVDTSQVEDYSQGYAWLDSADSVCGAYIRFQYPYKLVVPFTPVSVTTINLKTDIQMRLENQPNSGTCP
jgi:Flp pilus assembly protein TadG